MPYFVRRGYDMKKILIVTLMCVLLTGCGKDAVAQKVQDDISSIGEVSLDDESLIEKTYETYNTLTDKQKNQVNNYNELLEARDKIATLKVEAEEAKIKQIVGEWKGVALFIDDILIPINELNINAIFTINDDNTFELKVNSRNNTNALSGVWANIDSSELDDGELAYNFVTYEAEEVGQAILSTNIPFINSDSTYSLSFFFNDDDLSIQFEK